MLSELIESLLSEEKGYNPRIRPGLDSGKIRFYFTRTLWRFPVRNAING